MLNRGLSKYNLTKRPKIKPIMNARKEEWVKLFPKKRERKKKITERVNEIIYIANL